VTVLPVIAPSENAVQNGALLGQGESVSVECWVEGPQGDGRWFMLEDGTFLSEQDFVPQYGGKAAPTC